MHNITIFYMHIFTFTSKLLRITQNLPLFIFFYVYQPWNQRLWGTQIFLKDLYEYLCNELGKYSIQSHYFFTYIFAFSSNIFRISQISLFFMSISLRIWQHWGTQFPLKSNYEDLRNELGVNNMQFNHFHAFIAFTSQLLRVT